MARKKNNNGRDDLRAPARRPRAPEPPARRGAWGWLFRLFLWGLLFLGGAVLWFAHDLPDIEQLAVRGEGPAVTLEAADGTRLATFGALYGEAVALSDLPRHLPQAVMATEDRRFYDHPGVDLWGILRATLANLRAGHVVQGGSTITQQLAKNLFLGPERTFSRKIQEALLALSLEQRFAKDEIFALYLNRVYFGAGAYGVEAAARTYFGKAPQQLSLYESAMLAGLLKAPSRYNPARDGDLADARARVVLDGMAAAGFASAETVAAAKADPDPATGTLSGWGGRYFADWVMEQLPDFIGPATSDVLVRTTLDPKLQKLAEAVLARRMAEDGPKAGASQAALVVMSPDGAVRAMVGGTDYGRSQFNRATQALRQPGSAFKLFVFLAGLEAGMTPDTQLLDGPLSVGRWSPGNYEGKYRGQVTLREGFARSLNSVAVRVSERAGRGRVLNAARRLGITSDLHDGPSIALGTSEVTLLELTQAYATVADLGDGAMAYGITEAVNEAGLVLYRRDGSGMGRVAAEGHVGQLTDLLRSVVAWGTGKAADPGRPAAGKTGTSQDYRDAWFAGFTAELVGGVWVGNDDGKAMEKVTGGSLPARIWGEFMRAALEGEPLRPLPGLLLPPPPAARAVSAAPPQGRGETRAGGAAAGGAAPGGAAYPPPDPLGVNSGVR